MPDRPSIITEERAYSRELGLRLRNEMLEEDWEDSRRPEGF